MLGSYVREDRTMIIYSKRRASTSFYVPAPFLGHIIMNVPERFELTTLPEGAKKITHAKDQKVPDAATFTILAEDHTMANLLRMQLLRNPDVLFAGYQVPHPLSTSCEMEVMLNCIRTVFNTRWVQRLRFWSVFRPSRTRLPRTPFPGRSRPWRGRHILSGSGLWLKRTPIWKRERELWTSMLFD